MSLQTWLAFFVAAWAICLSPGPGVLSSVTAGLNFGYRGAVWNLVGLQAGAMLMLLVVGVGLGTVLEESPTVFSAVKWIGAGYLVWLGIQQWRSKAAPIASLESATQADAIPSTKSAHSLVLRGFLVNSSNPKGMIFTASVLPQFIDTHSPQLPQYLTVAGTLLVTDVCSMSMYTALGTRALRLLRSETVILWVNRTFGTVFIAFGLAIASFSHKN